MGTYAHFTPFFKVINGVKVSLVKRYNVVSITYYTLALTLVYLTHFL